MTIVALRDYAERPAYRAYPTGAPLDAYVIAADAATRSRWRRPSVLRSTAGRSVGRGDGPAEALRVPAGKPRARYKICIRRPLPDRKIKRINDVDRHRNSSVFKQYQYYYCNYYHYIATFRLFYSNDTSHFIVRWIHRLSARPRPVVVLFLCTRYNHL